MKVFFAFTSFLLAWPIFLSARQLDDIRWFEGLYANHQPVDAEQAIRLLEDQRRQAAEMEDDAAQSKALTELAVFHHVRLSNYEQAMELLVQSLTLAENHQLQIEKVFSLLAMARLFEEIGNFQHSEDYIDQALDLKGHLKDPSVELLILSEKGRILVAQGNRELALANYKQLLQRARQLKHSHREADALFHLAQWHCAVGDYPRALEQYKSALAVQRFLIDKIGEATSLNKIGELYLLMNNPERARANQEAALELWSRISDPVGIARSNNQLALIAIHQKEFARAVPLLNKAMQAGREGQAKAELLITYENLSYCYKQLQDYPKALEMKESMFALHEFIEHEKSERQVLETRNHYLLTQKEAAIRKLNEDREKDEAVIRSQQRVRNILLLLIACGVAIGLLIIYLYLHKQRSNRKLASLNATKDKLFSVIGHDLKGPLNSLRSFVTMLHQHTEYMSKEEIRMLSGDLDKSLRNLYNLLENLLDWARSQSGKMDFTAERFDLADVVKENEELLNDQLRNKGLTLHNETSTGLWVNAHRPSINTVIRNLISNAIKFTPAGGTITVKSKPEGNHWRISVKDTGVGMSEAFLKTLFQVGSKNSTLGTAREKGTGLGLILCKDFIEKNGGSLQVESQEGVGSQFHLRLPVLYSGVNAVG